jgi:colanic acid biosynthesis glycosyl transferase WcaI
MSGVSVPCRMYNIMAAGKPILAVADEDSELAGVVREENIGWVVSPGRPDQIIAAIHQARRLGPGVLQEMGRRARRAVEEKYTLANAVDSYEDVLGQIANDEPVAAV